LSRTGDVLQDELLHMLDRDPDACELLDLPRLSLLLQHLEELDHASDGRLIHFESLSCEAGHVVVGRLARLLEALDVLGATALRSVHAVFRLAHRFNPVVALLDAIAAHEGASGEQRDRNQKERHGDSLREERAEPVRAGPGGSAKGLVSRRRTG
jgi:hypothetical protein